jgi:hypothetical protein
MRQNMPNENWMGSIQAQVNHDAAKSGELRGFLKNRALPVAASAQIIL